MNDRDRDREGTAPLAPDSSPEHTAPLAPDSPPKVVVARTGVGAPESSSAPGEERSASWESVKRMNVHRLQHVSASDEEMPRVRVTRRQTIAFVLFVLSVVAFLYFVLPKISGPDGLSHTWGRIKAGNLWWLGAGVLLELCAFASYQTLFRAVFVRGPGRIGWKESYQITMAALAATRLFAAGGAGGVALTAWALRRSGLEARDVARRMVAFIVLLYFVYAASLLIDGLGLGTNLFPGGGSFAITIIPAIVAVVLLGGAGAVALLPDDVERRLERWASGSGRAARLVAGAVSVPATAASGVRTAIGLVRTRDPRLLGAPGWWGFDICVLSSCFHAFGHAPPFTVIWMCYFVGMLGNLLPLPGGVGGVDGGMIGAFVAFGVPLNETVVAVLAYRGIAFWLPTVPGTVAYFQLRRTVHRWRDEQTGERPLPELESSTPLPA